MFHRLAALICSSKSLERIVEPAIADLQKEYLHGGSRLSRTFALVRGYLAVARVIGIGALDVSETTEDDKRALTRTLSWALVLITAIALLLIVLPWRSFPGPIKSWYAAMTLAPQAVPLAIPIGLALAIACGLSARVARSAVKVVLLAAIVASLLSFATLAWAMPAGGQAFRELIIEAFRSEGYRDPVSKRWVPASLRKGYNEMTMSELRREVANATERREPRSARPYLRAFHFRFAFAAATLALATFLLVVPIDRRVLRGLLALAACGSYWALLYVGELALRHSYLTPFVSAWLPNIVFLTAAGFFVSWRLSRSDGSIEATQ